jgi:2-dehydro-3-deoxyphosphogluconate aldolase / (4S)-4-hydroxy-2-oxoglutarate aldolase
MMAEKNRQKGLEAALKSAPVVPVMVIEDVKQAVPLARALVAGGLPVLEITLRTDAAWDCIKAIKDEVEGAIVGAGTVLTPQQLRDCAKLDLAFAVSPGSTGRLLGEAEDYDLALLPGGATASEAMALLEWGYAIQKFFPAEAAGGSAYLAALASPLPHISFCPTGGITPDLAPGYLKLPNVITLGGSWMAPKALVAKGDWAAIEVLARTAASLKMTLH